MITINHRELLVTTSESGIRVGRIDVSGIVKYDANRIGARTAVEVWRAASFGELVTVVILRLAIAQDVDCCSDQRILHWNRNLGGGSKQS